MLRSLGDNPKALIRKQDLMTGSTYFVELQRGLGVAQCLPIHNINPRAEFASVNPLLYVSVFRTCKLYAFTFIE